MAPPSLAFLAPGLLHRPRPYRSTLPVTPRRLHASPQIRCAAAPSAVRAIAVIPPPAPPPAVARASTLATPGFSLSDRAVFLLGEFLMWNSFAKVLAMFVISAVFVVIGAYLFRLADPAEKDATSPFWRSIRGIVNPFEDDFELPATRAISVLLSFVGILFFGILVGLITEGLESSVSTLGATTKVAVRDHTLFCGWNSRVPQMIHDLASAPPSSSGTSSLPRRGVASAAARGRRGKPKIVILAPNPREEVLEAVRDAVAPEDLARVRLFVRTGRPFRAEDLEQVSVARAAKVVLVGEEGVGRDEASRYVLSRAIALRMSVPQYKGEIISEAHSERDERFVKSIVGTTTTRSVHTVAADVLLGRLVAQAIHQPGLFNVVSQIMNTQPSTSFQFLRVGDLAPGYVGRTYSELVAQPLEGALLCGYVDPVTGMPSLVASDDSKVLTDATELVVLGVPKRALPVPRGAHLAKVAQSPKSELNFEAAARAKDRPARRSPESILIRGWKADMEDMLLELDQTVPRGSRAFILADESCGYTGLDDADLKKLKNLKIHFKKGAPDRYDTLKEVVEKANCGQAVILSLTSGAIRDHLDADSRVLSTLVYLESLVDKNVKLTATFQYERTAELASKQVRVDNCLMPHVIGAKLASQAVRDGRVNHIWRELLSQRGREIYIRPVNRFVTDFGKASFTDVSRFAAEKYDEIVIGYRSRGELVLNPAGQTKFGTRTWLPSDEVLVLAK